MGFCLQCRNKKKKIRLLFWDKKKTKIKKKFNLLLRWRRWGSRKGCMRRRWGRMRRSWRRRGGRGARTWAWRRTRTWRCCGSRSRMASGRCWSGSTRSGGWRAASLSWRRRCARAWPSRPSGSWCWASRGGAARLWTRMCVSGWCLGFWRCSSDGWCVS